MDTPGPEPMQSDERQVLFSSNTKYSHSEHLWAHTFSLPSGSVYTTAQQSLTEPPSDHLSSQLQEESSEQRSLKSNGNFLKSSYTEF